MNFFSVFAMRNLSTNFTSLVQRCSSSCSVHGNGGMTL